MIVSLAVSTLIDIMQAVLCVHQFDDCIYVNIYTIVCICSGRHEHHLSSWQLIHCHVQYPAVTYFLCHVCPVEIVLHVIR